MTLNFTKAELLQLLQLAYIGNWVKHSDETLDNPREDTEIDEKVLQKISAAIFKAKIMGLIEYDMKSKQYVETRQFEDEVMPLVEQFNEDSFWDKLADKLAKRDMFNKYGEKGLAEMDNDTRFFELIEISDKYDDIFTTDGIKNLHLGDKETKKH
ncbi:hypothetical protein JYT55_00160 [Mariprofundus ferrooxydans]|nr:hypothetical protein [Mariprofundus ferrooxydans]